MCERSPHEQGDAFFKDLMSQIEANKHNPEVKKALEHTAQLFIKTHGRWDLTASLQGLTKD